VLSVLSSAVSGAAAGAARAVSIVLTFPLDTIKTRNQLRRIGAPVDPNNEFEKVIAASGTKGLFKGWLPRILVAVPAQACFFVTVGASVCVSVCVVGHIFTCL
jgi:hypothetical protein